MTDSVASSYLIVPLGGVVDEPLFIQILPPMFMAMLITAVLATSLPLIATNPASMMFATSSLLAGGFAKEKAEFDRHEAKDELYVKATKI